MSCVPVFVEIEFCWPPCLGLIWILLFCFCSSGYKVVTALFGYAPSIVVPWLDWSCFWDSDGFLSRLCSSPASRGVGATEGTLLSIMSPTWLFLKVVWTPASASRLRMLGEALLVCARFWDSALECWELEVGHSMVPSRTSVGVSAVSTNLRLKELRVIPWAVPSSMVKVLVLLKDFGGLEKLPPPPTLELLDPAPSPELILLRYYELDLILPKKSISIWVYVPASSM